MELKVSDIDFTKFSWEMKEGGKTHSLALNELPLGGKFPELSADSLRLIEAAYRTQQLQKEASGLDELDERLEGLPAAGLNEAAEEAPHMTQ